MAEKIYVLTHNRAKEFRWHRSKEERVPEKMKKAFEEAGGQHIVDFTVLSPKWGRISVDVFPDMESYIKYRQILRPPPLGINAERYWDVDITLGYDPPPRPEA
jgi:hypothetical protein